MTFSLSLSIVVLSSISLAYGCAPTPAPTPPNPPPNPAPPSTGRTTNVLWLGNSYTYLHDVPKMVQELGRYEGKSISYDQHTNGGWTLQKHANSAVIIVKTYFTDYIYHCNNVRLFSNHYVYVSMDNPYF